MKANMKTREVKEQFGWNWMRPEIVTIHPEASVEEAIGRMATFSIHHLLVMEQARVVGILEARDIVAHKEVYAQPKMAVAEVMRIGISAVDEDCDVQTALERILNSGGSALPISRKGEVCGILTETDLLRLLNAMLKKRSLGEGIGAVLEQGELWLSHIGLQRLFKALSDSGI